MLRVRKKMKAYKYRAYPTKEQATAIDQQIEQCRQLYNKLLSLKKDAYKQTKTKLSRFDLIKKTKGKNKEAYSQVSQNVADRINKAYGNFFARVKRGEEKKGFPRFKKYGGYSSITLPQIVNPEKIVKKTLAIRTHKCQNCGLKIDRDTNAARNILTIGKIGLEQPKLTPERDKATTDGISPKQALSMKQEATQLVGW